jgi:NAD(P) transhydrogenase
LTDTRYDLVVLGAGPAGEKGAAQAAWYGKRVAVIEKLPRVGGGSAHTGTLPSKTLREAAIFLSGFKSREIYGLDVKIKENVTIQDLMQRKDEVVDWEVARMENNLARHGIETIHGEGTIAGPHEVVVKTPVGERRLETEFILIATGSSPHRPSWMPFNDPDVDDSDEILKLDRIPSTYVILGAGVIGCEYACLLAALGVRVYLCEARDKILPFLDDDLSNWLVTSMKRLGIEIVMNDVAEAVERTRPVDPAERDGPRGSVAGGPSRLAVKMKSGRVLQTSRVLYTTGRVGNTKGLGLEALGIPVDSRGRVSVDPDYKTAVDSIYAAGDVIGHPALAATSMEQGRVAVCHAFGFTYKQKVAEQLPYGIYTIPEVSSVGEGEREAKARGEDVEIGVAKYATNARGQIVGDRDGFIKLVFRAADKKLLGVHCIGERATELVHIGQAVYVLGGTIDYFVQAVFNYPTLAETYKYAAYDGLGRLARRGK